MAREILNKVIEFLVTYSFEVLGAIIILIAGFIISRWVPQIFIRFCEKRHFDITLTKFFAGLIRISILAFTLIIALGKFGITIAPFVAAISALAFGSTFAFQGPLSNYGAGLSLLLTRPFAIHDVITVQGVSGEVEDIRLACTILKTPDGVRITIPNKQIVGEILYNSKQNLIVDTVVGIRYSDDPEKAIRIVLNVIRSFPQILAEPAAYAGIGEFADSSISIAMRYWVPASQFFQTRGDVNLAIYRAFEKEGITIPFPQREIRVLNGNGDTAAGLRADQVLRR